MFLLHLVGADRSFTYDYVYSETSRQVELFDECVASLVTSFTQGYNATIVAYGQTGSGKTYSMGTSSNNNVSSEDLGIVPRVVRMMFQILSARGRESEFLVKVNFLEIYNDELRDLLNPSSNNKTGQIREDVNGSIYVSGVIEEEVKSPEEMLACLDKGSLCRATGSTNMNAHSSRSHAIFTVHLSQKNKRPPPEEGEEPEPEGETFEAETLLSKFHFVDLAGSERLKRTGAIGQRMKEGININQGLLALGNVISALGDESRRGQHVPFRDSKITRMLQDSLGGNSQTLMIACVSPADINFEETLNTLKYANRARNIKNKPIINRDPIAAKMEKMRLRIRELEAALRNAGGTIDYDASLAAFSAEAEETMMIKQQQASYEYEIQRLTSALKENKKAMSTMNDKLISAQTEKDLYRIKLHKALRQVQAMERNEAPDAEDGNHMLPEPDESSVGISTKESDLVRENHKRILELEGKLRRKRKAFQEAIAIIETYQKKYGAVGKIVRNPLASTASSRREFFYRILAVYFVLQIFFKSYTLTFHEDLVCLLSVLGLCREF